MKYPPLALLLLAACSSPAEEPEGEPAPEPRGETIACALGDGADFAENCTLERRDGEVVIHHPDGGFRRFMVDPAGGGLIAADGADGSIQAIDGETLVLTVGPDRYRIPVRPMAETPSDGNG